MLRISQDLFCFQDTCNVYLIRNGQDGVLIDFGSGDVLDNLEEVGIQRVTDVLMTHHHRDQGQGLARAARAGIRIWVPEAEQDLFARVDLHWQARRLDNDYNNRQDRFSLLEPVPITGTLREYVATDFAGRSLTAVPTPGHTVGSVSILGEVDGRKVCFTGDLIAAPGKVWSLAATQWSYNGAEGVLATILSGRDLARRGVELLLPSHGRPMDDPTGAFSLLESRSLELMALRREHPALLEHFDHPFIPVTPHLVHNRTSHAYSYVLISESGKALVIDYGYDFETGLAAGTDRAARRPWLYNIPRLKEEFGVTSIDVAIPTHYHDDHVGGFNLLRSVEGTSIWAADDLVDVLEHPTDHDLPCLWYDPIPVDRSLPVGEPIAWEEYELMLHPLPGHTLYQVAIEVTVDGKCVLAVGDQFVDLAWLFYLHDQSIAGGSAHPNPLPAATKQNYVYRNGFRLSDYRETAALYRKVRPDILLYGHWPPSEVDAAHFARLDELGTELERIHRELLPLDEVDFGAEGAAAWIRPYRAEVSGGMELALAVEVLNPFSTPSEADVALVVPQGWHSWREESQGVERTPLDANGRAVVRFCVKPPLDERVRRARIAADLTVGGQRFGQVAEALVTVR